MRRTIQVLRDEIENYKRRIRDLESVNQSERGSSSRKISDLESSNRVLTAENERLKSENQALTSKNSQSNNNGKYESGFLSSSLESQLKEEILILKKEITRTKDGLESERKESDSLRNHIKMLNQQQVPQNRGSNMGMVDDEQEVSQLKINIQRKQGEVSTMDAEDLMERISRLRQELEQAEEISLQESRKAAGFKKTVDSQEALIGEMKKKLDHFKSEAQETENSKEKALKRMQEMEKELVELQNEKTKAIAVESQLRTQFTESEGKLKAQLVELESKYRSASIESESIIKFQVEYLTKENQAKDEKIQSLTQSMASMSRKKQDSNESSFRVHSKDEESMSIMKDENENLRRLNQKLLIELNEMRGENSNLRTSRNSYSSQGREYQELTNKLISLESKLANDRENGMSIIIKKSCTC